MRFRNRIDAGQQLGERLAALALAHPVVLGLPRGGVPVAWMVAKRLGAELDVFVARKVGAPGHEELGIGAVAEGSDEIVITDDARRLGLDEERMQRRAAAARAEVQDRVDAYRGSRPLPSLEGRDVIVVDDGLATGITTEAALRALRRHEPLQLVLAVPVGAREAIDRLARIADRVECVHTPDAFYAVGEWYDDFRQTTDTEVRKMLPRRTDSMD